MRARYDPRPFHRQMSESVVVWTYIIGLSSMLIAWAFLAYAAIGDTTQLYPNYNLPDPTPAAQAYNTIGTYQRPRR